MHVARKAKLMEGMKESMHSVFDYLQQEISILYYRTEDDCYSSIIFRVAGSKEILDNV